MKLMRCAMLGLLGMTGCLNYLLPEGREYLAVHWAPDLATAESRALAQDKPLLVILAAGELTGASCVGADALRGGALSDPDVIQMVNAGFVPVWINIRQDPVPDLPHIEQVFTEAVLDSHRKVADLFGKNFFVRSAVFSPDLKTFLNAPEAADVPGSMWSAVTEGHFAYAEVTARDYVELLGHSLDRLQGWRQAQAGAVVQK